jgi:hypothetical protein
MEKRSDRHRLPATGPGPEPGEFLIGSLQSRAAARSLLESRRTTEGAGILFRLRRIGKDSAPNRECTCTMPAVGTFSLCRCFA